MPDSNAASPPDHNSLLDFIGQLRLQDPHLHRTLIEYLAGQQSMSARTIYRHIKEHGLLPQPRDAHHH